MVVMKKIVRPFVVVFFCFFVCCSANHFGGAKSVGGGGNGLREYYIQEFFIHKLTGDEHCDSLSDFYANDERVKATLGDSLNKTYDGIVDAFFNKPGNEQLKATVSVFGQDVKMWIYVVWHGVDSYRAIVNMCKSKVNYAGDSKRSLEYMVEHFESRLNLYKAWKDFIVTIAAENTFPSSDEKKKAILNHMKNCCGGDDNGKKGKLNYLNTLEYRKAGVDGTYYDAVKDLR